jgi:hypothetical protein
MRAEIAEFAVYFTIVDRLVEIGLRSLFVNLAVGSRQWPGRPACA